MFTPKEVMFRQLRTVEVVTKKKQFNSGPAGLGLGRGVCYQNTFS